MQEEDEASNKEPEWYALGEDVYDQEDAPMKADNPINKQEAILREEEDASAKRAKLRKEMGEELYKQYFPNEEAEEVRNKEWVENYKKPEWLTKKKNKKVDYSDWNI